MLGSGDRVSIEASPASQAIPWSRHASAAVWYGTETLRLPAAVDGRAMTTESPTARTGLCLPHDRGRVGPRQAVGHHLWWPCRSLCLAAKACVPWQEARVVLALFVIACAS